MIKKLLILLIRMGLFRRPKKHIYTVYVKVLLDQVMIKRFPTEVRSFSRRSAVHETQKRLSAKTGTTAKCVGYLDESKARRYEVTLSVVLDRRKIIQAFPAHVTATKRRDAKFEITKRLTLKAVTAVRKDHLVKHVLNHKKRKLHDNTAKS